MNTITVKRENPTEAQVQYELCKALEHEGFYFLVECPLKTPMRNRRNRVVKVVPDVLLMLPDGQTAYAVIEVKNRPIEKSGFKYEGSRQYDKYVSISLPFTYCNNITEIDTSVKWAKEILRKIQKTA